MIVLVCGSRNWDDLDCVWERLAELNYTTVIHGAARGADECADTAARELGYEIIRVPADWEQHGKRAGYLRNIEMLEMKPDLVLAFWDGESKGTKHTIDEALKRRIRVEVIF